MPARQRAIGSSQQPIAIDDSDDGVTPARANRGGEPAEDSDDSSVVDVETFRRRHARSAAGQASQAEPVLPATQAVSGGPKVRSARKTINSRRPGPPRQVAHSSDEEDEQQTPRARPRAGHDGRSSKSNPASASTSPIKTPKALSSQNARVRAAGQDLPDTPQNTNSGRIGSSRQVATAAQSPRSGRRPQPPSSQRTARERPIIIDSDSDPAPRQRRPLSSSQRVSADGSWGNPIDRSARPVAPPPNEAQVEEDIADGSWGHPIDRSAPPAAPTTGGPDAMELIADGSWGHPIDRSANRADGVDRRALSPTSDGQDPLAAEPDTSTQREPTVPAGSWGHPVDRSQDLIPQRSQKDDQTRQAGPSQHGSKKRSSPPTPVRGQGTDRRAKGKARRLSPDLRHEALAGPPSRIGPTWKTYSDTEPSGRPSPLPLAAQDELMALPVNDDELSGVDTIPTPVPAVDEDSPAANEIDMTPNPTEAPKEGIIPSTSDSSNVSAILSARTSNAPLPQPRQKSSSIVTVESTRVEVEQAVEEMRTGVEDVQLLPETDGSPTEIQDAPSGESETLVVEHEQAQAPEVATNSSDSKEPSRTVAQPQAFEPREFKSFFGNQSSLDFVKNLMAKFTTTPNSKPAGKPLADAPEVRSGEEAQKEAVFQILETSMDVDEPIEVEESSVAHDGPGMLTAKAERGDIGGMNFEIISVHDSDSDSDRMEGPSSRPYGRTRRIASTPATSPTPPRIMSHDKWLEVVQNGGDSDICLSSDLLCPTFPNEVYPVEDFEKEYPPGRRGTAIRTANTKIHEDWHKMEPQLTRMPELHREIFAGYITEATSIDEPQAAEIQVLNDVDEEGAPQDFEFAYSNRPLYAKAIPDPELTAGCGCDGPCDPHSKTCSCLKLQKLYSYDLDLDGFAYDTDGSLKEGLINVSIWECGPNCGCPPECMNRVIQRGRASTTEVDIFKTRNRGWGVKARKPIPRGTFLGIYSGEIITEGECERRGRLYGDIGRTYLFDCDGYQISNPPDGISEIDERLGALAAAAQRRAVRMALHEDDNYSYSACSVDAFHYGNFTRFLNHRCDPNLTIAQAYAFDFHPERPLLVIFARRDIKKGEECCISYKGLPDEAVPEPVKKVVKRAIGRGQGKKGKSSTAAHVALNKTVRNRQAKDLCKCGAWNCDGQMFGVNPRDEPSGSPDL